VVPSPDMAARAFLAGKTITRSTRLHFGHGFLQLHRDDEAHPFGGGHGPQRAGNGGVFRLKLGEDEGALR
jgi:hypothetical protein